MKRLIRVYLSVFTLALCGSSYAKEFITVGSDVVEKVRLKGLMENSLLQDQRPGFIQEFDGTNVLHLNEKQKSEMGRYIHHYFNRCGGYTTHQTLQEAEAFVQKAESGVTGNFVNYQVNQRDEVVPLVAQVEEINIRNFIKKFSSFLNRMHNSAEGVAAAKWLADHWKELTAHRSDVTVELIEHPKWKQPSVMATIHGRTDERVVVGGHLDSISYKRPPFFKTKNAPGADDNASGIGTITEALRILASSNYTPQKTLVFIGYAAEEVGLKGSREIARNWRKKGVNVAGVAQFDMTNYKGSSTIINIVNDYTNKEQNSFMGELIDAYVHVPWGFTSCGYACSDHASWTAEGFAASAPFESKKRDMNRKIHTPKDTLENLGGDAHHATHFAKLAVAYLVEMNN